MSAEARPWGEGLPPVVAEWIVQLRSDVLLHRLVWEACRAGEQVDVEIVAVLRANSGSVCLAPSVKVRR